MRSKPRRSGDRIRNQARRYSAKIEAPISALPSLGREIRKVARDTYQSASDMADGMDVLAGMGANRDDALGMLPAIGRTATAYNAEITDLSQAGYAALSNLKVPASQLSYALDAMAQAGKDGAFELKDMAKYFPQLGAGYQALGQKGVPAVADLSAALQIVRKGTGDSASAATNLSNVLQKINAPLTRKAFAKMGVNLEKEMKKAAKAGLTPIEAIAEITNRTLKGDLGKLGDLFQDAQVQQGLRPLIQNMEEYRRIRESAMKAQGVVQEDYERRLKTSAAAAKRFRISMENIGLAIGSALLPALNSLADIIVPIVNRMAEFAETHPQLTVAIVATTAALVALRVAAIAAQFSLLWMRGGLLTGTILSLKAFRGVLAGLSLVFAPLLPPFVDCVQP
ncbi:phage tail tape measure protein [Ochrobactrum daejeonense]|nr:phage tail tape measure protein [Brucella daejeonensis]